VAINPKGERQTVHLQQTGPGRYEGKFAARDVGAYQMNLMDIKDGQLRSAQTVGASVNYSPEFNATEPNLGLLQRLAESGGGRRVNLADPTDNPFLHDRQKTFQPRDLWEWLLKLAILLFPVDVAVRRIQLDRDELRRAWQILRRWLWFWRGVPQPVRTEESWAALLARRDQVRLAQTGPAPEAKPELLKPPRSVARQPVRPLTPAPTVSRSGPVPDEVQPSPGDVSTASRLLEAKRRAQKRTP
jgi:hypothetical protein